MDHLHNEWDVTRWTKYLAINSFSDQRHILVFMAPSLLPSLLAAIAVRRNLSSFPFAPQFNSQVRTYANTNTFRGHSNEKS